MRFRKTELPGVVIVEIEPITDERGFFARSFCSREFEEHGLDACVAQCNISFNRRAGTLRGMHFQRAPWQEAKLIRCTAGEVFDVIVDLRPSSPAFLRHVAVVLTATNHQMVYVPKGFAHGFQTLVDDTEVFYQMSVEHQPHSAAGLRWNDPGLAIRWPREVTMISERDASLEDFRGVADPRLQSETIAK